MGYPEIMISNPENFRMGHIVYWNMRYGKKILKKFGGNWGMLYLCQK